VIASPGTGKTTAVTERIANLINRDVPVENFIVVTYTDKAAREIKNRVHGKILTQTISKASLANFESIFFGTIHGFCAKFLREHHRKVGIGEDFEIIDDDRELWNKFVARLYSTMDSIIPAELHSCMAKHFRLSEILAKARVMVPLPSDSLTAPKEAPTQNVADILHYTAGAHECKVLDFQENVKIWMRSNGTCTFPEIPRNCGHTFNKYFSETMGEYLQWRSDVQNYLIGRIAAEYVAYKIASNCLGYQELTTLTLKILLDVEYRKKHVKNHHVILDEAQDTDEMQFKILLNLVSPGFYEKISNKEECNEIETASFSMVGDPKQSIYPERADVKFYLSLHERLVDRKFVKQLNFDLTLRCHGQIVEFVNNAFKNAFSCDGIEFSKMCARPLAPLGHVDVLKGESMQVLAQIFFGETCQNLGVKNFCDVCILAPRKSWLHEIANSFAGNGLMPKVQFGICEPLENIPSLLKWTASALHFLNNICDHREFAGILREIFGISTSEVIQYFNHSNSETCKEIHDDFISLKREQGNFSLTNFVRRIMDKFCLVARIRLLDIFSEDEISTQYETIMDLTYGPRLSCDDLEKKLISAYKKPPTSTVVDKDAVQLFSFHKSKGLEWDVVILPFMHRRRKLVGSDSATILANEKRMLFVACTRAKERLILTDDSECYSGNKRSNIISSASLIGMYNSMNSI
jgi:ATP-dependent exoDNAse (exonuclease V) beta subunit